MKGYPLLMQLREQGLTLSLFDEHHLRVEPLTLVTEELRTLIQSHKTDLIEALHDLSPRVSFQELRAFAGDDFKDYEKNPPAFEALEKLLVNHRLLSQGKVPLHYTKKAYCTRCGEVWLPASLATLKPLLGCPWCHYPTGNA